MKHRDIPAAAAVLDTAAADNPRHLIDTVLAGTQRVLDGLRPKTGDQVDEVDARLIKQMEDKRDTVFGEIVRRWANLTEDVRQDLVSIAYGMPIGPQAKRGDVKPHAIPSLVMPLFAAMYEHNPEHTAHYTDASQIKRHVLASLLTRDNERSGSSRSAAGLEKIWRKLDPALVGVVSTTRYWRDGDVLDAASHLYQLDDATSLAVLDAITTPIGIDPTGQILKNAAVITALSDRLIELPDKNRAALIYAMRPQIVWSDTETAQELFREVFSRHSPSRQARYTNDFPAEPLIDLYNVGEQNWWLLEASAEEFAMLVDGTHSWSQQDAIAQQLLICAQTADEPEHAAGRVGQLVGSNAKMLGLITSATSMHRELLALALPYVSEDVLAKNPTLAIPVVTEATRTLAGLILDIENPDGSTYGSEIPKMSYELIDRLGAQHLGNVLQSEELMSARSVIAGYATFRNAISERRTLLKDLDSMRILTDD
jgi:hypothetical protein